MSDPGPLRFHRYVGIDYSGAATPTSSLSGLRVYEAARETPAEEIAWRGPKKHWTRRGIAEWLVAELAGDAPSIVGIDHAFSFPESYFDEHGVSHDWDVFLDDFRRHWPTDADDATVQAVRDGALGNGENRSGRSSERRVTDRRAGAAKSVFHFDVPGSVAKSTHAGLPWLRFIRRELGERVHFWPFDGWNVPAGRSVVAEVFPTLWRPMFPRGDRMPDQHDAYVVAAWLRRADGDGSLAEYLAPELSPDERAAVAYEGWILGVR